MSSKAVWFLIFLLLFCLAHLFITLPSVLEVNDTGICPAGPPDTPPYPCTVSEYLVRVFLGPFGLFGNLVLMFVCGSITLILKLSQVGLKLAVGATSNVIRAPEQSKDTGDQ